LNKSLTFIAKNEKMRKILSGIDRIVDSDSSILLIGETGSGKEIIAEYIHNTSNRADKPFVKISLSAMPAELLESELFGHERGAFTSASTEKKGLFEIANTGSIFLDDIDDIPLQIQTKLLRVLESRELMKVGGTRPVNIDVRLITASKIDLKELVNRGIFRSDLFYRINVVPINIPPLRERRDDIELLFNHFIKYYKTKKPVSISTEALQTLVNYSWPGNVRELKNTVQRIVLFVDSDIKNEDLPVEIKNENPGEFLIKACQKCYTEGDLKYEQIISCLEHNLLRDSLIKHSWNQSKAAKSLGLSLSTFRDKLKRLNVSNPSAPAE
jgi:DNA-binding NtrC family response regulator